MVFEPGEGEQDFLKDLGGVFISFLNVPARREKYRICIFHLCFKTYELLISVLYRGPFRPPTAFNFAA
jgi:hypothetical protein